MVINHQICQNKPQKYSTKIIKNKSIDELGLKDKFVRFKRQICQVQKINVLGLKDKCVRFKRQKCQVQKIKMLGLKDKNVRFKRQKCQVQNEVNKEIKAKNLKQRRLQIVGYKQKIRIEMVSLIVAGTLLIFIWTIENGNTSNILALVFGITLTYVYRYSIHNNFSSEQLLKYALYGQNLYALLYIVWLSFFDKSTYVFYVPLFFSSIAKIIWLFTAKDQLNVDFLQETSLFQTKTEIFLIGYSFVSILYGGFPVVLQLFLLILILKLKYSFHQKAQQAFKELHFVIDNIFKRTKLRSKYQKFVQIIGLIGQIHGGSKEIIY